MPRNYTQNFREQTSRTSGTEPVYCLEITHPQLAIPARVVNDTQDLIHFPSVADESGTAQAASSNTLTLASGAVATDDHYNGWLLKLKSGPGSVQQHKILDYDGLSKVATLEEDWRTNYLRHSEAFDNVAWTKSNVTVTPNAIHAPNGSLTGTKVDPLGGGSTYVLQASTGILTGQACKYSISGKAGVGRYIRFEFLGSRYSGGGVTFDLLTGTKIGGQASDTIVHEGDGWYRCTATRTALIDNPSNAVFVTNVSIGTPGEYVYLWGATEGITDGEYIKTEGSAIVLPNNTTQYDLVEPDTFIACAFRVSFPDEIADSMPKAPIAIDNIGRELTQWLEASDGGRGATVRIMQIMRDTPDIVEQEYTLDLLGVQQNMMEITASLGYENLLDQPALAATYTPELAPGLF